MPLSDQFACEDVVMFVNAAITSTAQREFRAGAAEQRLSLGFLHEYVLGNFGETITDDAGALVYLKTFRLSAAQTRRGHLLSQLAAHDWDLDATATTLGTDRPGLALRLDRSGFGHLLRPDIVEASRNRARRQLNPRPHGGRT